MLQRGRETWRKERRERERERSMGRGETKVSDSEAVGWEKVRKLTMRERMRQKIMFPMATDKDNIYKRCNAWERDCFPKIFFGKQPIENKPYFIKVFHWLKIVFHWSVFFLCYQILENVENYIYRRFSSETNRARLD